MDSLAYFHVSLESLTKHHLPPKGNLVECEAHGLPNSSGKRCLRLVLEGFPGVSIAAARCFAGAKILNAILPKSPYIRVKVCLDPAGARTTWVYVNASSLASRLDVPLPLVRKIVQQDGEGSLFTCLRLAQDRALFTERQEKEENEKDVERDKLLQAKPMQVELNSFADIVEKVKQRKSDLRLSCSLFSLKNSCHVNKSGFIAFDDPFFSYVNPPHAFKGSQTSKGIKLMRETVEYQPEVGHNFKRQAEVFLHFTGKEGVLSLQEVSFYLNKYGKKKVAFFYPRYHHSLADILTSTKLSQCLAEKDRYNLALQLLEGLVHINKVGCHNQLEPSSILVSLEQKKAVIGNLKEFRFIHPQDAEGPFLDPGKQLIWQERSAPELLEGHRHKIDPSKTDVWSMGFVLLELLATKPDIKDLFSERGRGYPLGYHIEKAGLKNETQFLIRAMLESLPRKRWSAQECLTYFKEKVMGEKSQLSLAEEEKNFI